MKVFIDYQAFRHRVGGVSRVVAEHMRHFSDDVDVVTGIEVSDNIYLRDLPRFSHVNPVPVSQYNFLTKRSFKGKYTAYKWLERHFRSFPTFDNINRRVSTQLLKNGGFDLFHCPITTGSDYFLPYIGNKPFVLTVHDMISEYYAEFKADSVLKTKLVSRADHIIAISKHTKDELIRIMNVPESRISVIYHGAPEKLEVKERLVEEPYFVYVGRREEYKNFTQTLRDFAEFHAACPEVCLICVGSPFTKEERLLMSQLHLHNCVSVLSVSDAELASLYSHAIAFVYPSMFEGFGLPILEAFTYSCPVLCNNRSCLPEIAGDAALYFDSVPGKSDLPELLHKIYTASSAQRQVLVGKGLIRLNDFSWEKSAREVEGVYKSLL